MTVLRFGMAADAWATDRLDLAGYLGHLGIAAREPSREALNELHGAQARSVTFSNIDVRSVSTRVSSPSPWPG